jgi:leucyl aminopeptidase (aminopeptidase T)
MTLGLAMLAATACAQPGAPENGTAAQKPAATIVPVTAAIDTKELAGKLVRNAAVKEGEVVLVSGGGKDWALIEDLAVEIRKVGAFPLISTSSEQLVRRLAEEPPAKFDSQRPTLALKLAEMADVAISLDYIEHNDLLSPIPSERLAAQAAAAQPAAELARKRNQRTLNLGNGLLPTMSTANEFAVPQESLAKIYWAGINTDYNKLQATAQSVSQALAGGKRVRITNPNGTDLTVEIAGRPVFASDGVISDDDIKRGGGGVQVWLPAGEVYVTPVMGTAEGKVIADHYFYQGTTIEKLELTFVRGKLTDMRAASGLDRLKANYDAFAAGKEEFAFIDIGINPDVALAPNSRMVAWMPAGMVTVGTGNNLWAGGTNSNPFGINPFLPGSTLEVDGKVLVKNGQLVN